MHRDVKPSNILVAIEPGEREHVYLSDFGLTRRRPRTGAGFFGSPRYAAPEQIEGGPVDGRADVYALGCVLVECLTGTPPFQGGRVEVLWEHLEHEPPRPTARRPDLPPAIDQVAARALAKDPDDRHSTCRELCDDARQALGLTERRFSRRALLAVAGGAAIAVAAAVAVPLTATRGRGDRERVASATSSTLKLPLTEPSLLRVETPTGRLISATPLEVAPGGLGPLGRPVALGAGAVWVVSTNDRQLVQVDPRTAKIRSRVDVTEAGRPSVLAATEEAVWLIDVGTSSRTSSTATSPPQGV